MDFIDALELFEAATRRSPVTIMDFTDMSAPGTDDISRPNKNQLEAEDLPPSISQTPQDEEQTESGILMQSYEMNNEHNLETANEIDHSEFPMDEGNSIHANQNPCNECPIVLKEVSSQPSDVESSSDTAVNRPEMTSETVQTVKEPPRNRQDKHSLEFQYKIIRFMKEYYEKDPSASQAEIKRAMMRHLNLQWSETKLSIYIAAMIKSYRNVRGIIKSQKCSFEDLDEKFYKQCPYYKELHEALQLSDFYRNDNGKRGRQRNKVANKPVRRIRNCCCLTCSKEEIDVNVARPKDRNKTPKTKSELIDSNTKSTNNEDQLRSEMMDKEFIPSKEMWEGREIFDGRSRARSIAIFMKEYFKKNPSSSVAEMARTYKKLTKSPYALLTLTVYVSRMIKRYRELRIELDGFKSGYSSYMRKLISERCPYFDDIHEAYQYSDFYRNSNWEPGGKAGAHPRPQTKFKSSTSTTSTSSKDNENEETSVCEMFPKLVKGLRNEGKSNTSLDHNLESSVIEEEEMIGVPPLKSPYRDHKQAGSDAAIETPPLEVPDCDHKQDSINEAVEQGKAIVKNPIVINESKLSSEQQLELIKQERQLQMQMTKMKHEYDIKILKLQIKYERVKNLKQ